MERWFQYKNMILNIRQHRGFTVRKLRKDAMAYCDPEVNTKGKPWVLYLDHTGIEAFKTKEEAMKLAEDIVTGKYDIKI